MSLELTVVTYVVMALAFLVAGYSLGRMDEIRKSEVQMKKLQADLTRLSLILATTSKTLMQFRTYLIQHQIEKEEPPEV